MSYQNSASEDDKVCQVCGADRWSNTDKCPMCGSKYAEAKSTWNVSAKNNGKKKYVDNGTSSGYLSPYERGVFDKDPDADKKKRYHDGVVPVRTIVTIVLIVGLLVALVILGTRVVSEYVEEEKAESSQNEKAYEFLNEAQKDPSRTK